MIKIRHDRRDMRAMRWAAVLIFVMVVAPLQGCIKPGIKVDGHVGVIDVQRLLDETIVGKRAQDSLAVYSKNRQMLIELESKELRRLQEDTERQRTVLSQEAFRERAERFQRRVEEYQQKVAELNKEIQEKQKDVLDRFREKVEIVVAKLSKRVGLRMVLDKGKGGPTIYTEDTLDITNHVIEEMDSEYP